MNRAEGKKPTPKNIILSGRLNAFPILLVGFYLMTMKVIEGGEKLIWFSCIHISNIIEF
jgi:hypothetical protein